MEKDKMINDENDKIQKKFQIINSDKNSINQKCKELEKEYSIICNQMETLCSKRTDLRTIR